MKNLIALVLILFAPFTFAVDNAAKGEGPSKVQQSPKAQHETKHLERFRKYQPVTSDTQSLLQSSLEEITLSAAKNGEVQRVFGRVSSPTTVQQQGKAPFNSAIAFFKHHETAFGKDRSAVPLDRESTRLIAHGQKMVRFGQKHKGIPVYGSDAYVKYDASGSIVTQANLNVDPYITVNTVPSVKRSSVRQYAGSLLKKARILDGPSLVIYSAEIDKSLEYDALAWVVDIEGEGDDGNYKNIIVAVDAHNGRVIRGIDNTLSAINRRIYNTAGITSFAGLPGTNLARTEGGPSSSDSEVNLAYVRALNSYNYYKQFGWKSFNGNDEPLVVGVRQIVTAPQLNAFYYHGSGSRPNQIVFSTGMMTKDIFTHEMGHALIRHTGNLTYHNSSGAANESIADTFGAYHDTANWTLGEGSAAYGGAPYRDMANPGAPGALLGLFGHPYPDHINEYLCTFFDNGGVHHNSSILNHAAYNLAQVTGRFIAGNIYFEAIDNCISELSGFTGTRLCVLAAATQYGATLAAKNAFDDVGLTLLQPEPICSFFQSCTVTIYIPPVPDDFNIYGMFGDAAYALRDSVFADSELGQHYIDLYYDHTAQVAGAITSDVSLFMDGAALIADALPGLQSLVGFSDDDVTVTADFITNMQGFLANIQAADDSPNGAMAGAVSTESNRIDWNALEGKTFSEAWEYLDQSVSLD